MTGITVSTKSYVCPVVVIQIDNIKYKFFVKFDKIIFIMVVFKCLIKVI